MNAEKMPFDSPLGSLVAGSAMATGAASLYQLAVGLRNRRFEQHPEKIKKTGRPVISVGGIRAGGSGKTPATMLLIDCFLPHGYDIAVVSRGYKRKFRKPLQVVPGERPSWDQIGDEPAMMRASYPGIWLGIGQDRFSNIVNLRHKMSENALFILDDGFQHRNVYRDLDIVCIHDSIFFDRLLPQGYLREPIASLSRAHLLFLITTEGRVDHMKEVGLKLSQQFPSIDQYILFNKIEGWVHAVSGTIVKKPPFSSPIAFCGIARPHRFFESLDEQGIQYCKKMTFPDHHDYREDDFSTFRKLYSQGFITTEKDSIRLLSKKIIPLDLLWFPKMRLHFAENDSLNRFNNYIKCIGNWAPVYNHQKEA